VKKPQWITLFAGVGLVIFIYYFGKTVSPKKTVQPSANVAQTYLPAITADTILAIAKSQLNPAQLASLNNIEGGFSKIDPNLDAKEQRLSIYHRLAHFWEDSARIFEPYAWYEAEAARLENSEKSLTFAARLFLDNLQQDSDPERVRWKALQAKDLFERSLKINPDNDSSKVGLGACYLFGHISAAPMEGIAKIREVAEKDSTNTYAQMMLAKGSLVSGQFDKAISRLHIVNRHDPENIEAILMLADVYERTRDKANAIVWYKKSLQYIDRIDARTEIVRRIAELEE
jgi:tetratricopeptide (TPR) repeat protein